jgi:hypothetical protein
MWFWQKYTSPWSLSQAGILGMNKRNHSYISRYNPRRLYPLVDDKLKTKRIALDAGVTVPELIGTIREQHDVTRITALVKDWPGFCIKPARGSGSKGILVILRQETASSTSPTAAPPTARIWSAMSPTSWRGSIPSAASPTWRWWKGSSTSTTCSTATPSKGSPMPG